MDDEGNLVLPGDHVSFTYGIPPVHVIAKVATIRGESWVLTPGHKPNRCRLRDLREFVGGYFKHAGPVDPLTQPD